MKNLRTHMWLCFALGVFQLIAFATIYFVTRQMDSPSMTLYLTPEFFRTGMINSSIYMVYFLIVLFKAIKYTPSKA